MSKVKVAINGMGRIGRTILREYLTRNNENLEIVAVNNPGDLAPYVHLINYDSLHGKLQTPVTLEGDTLTTQKGTIKFFSTPNPAEIDWPSVGAQVVIDATGRFKDKEALSAHLRDSVKKVIMCAPGKNLDGTFVMGINNETYDNGKHHIISNASCTTNCLSPLVKVLHENFGIENGFMTTVHAYTSDQNILDNSHKDIRRSRAAAMSMIPTSTGAAKALGDVIPEMKGKLDGYAVRVPTPDVSMVDLTVNLKKSATVAQVNQAMKEAANSNLKGVLGYTEEELVSIDYMGRPESSVFDSKLTNVLGNNLKVVSWYDNEVGFSNRVLDLSRYIGEKL